MKEVPTAVTPMQKIPLERIERSGRILDLGGGGEGIVSRLEGQRVYAVDASFQKIREARIHPTDSQWILADARSLCFQDSMFDIATFWFSLGYFRDMKSKKTALREACRSLKKGGRLSIIAASITCPEDRFVFKTQLTFPDGTTSQMAFAVKGNQNQDADVIMKLVKDVGFEVAQLKEYEYWFRIKAQKL